MKEHSGNAEPDRSPEPCALAVHEHVDVLADLAAFVEDPAGQPGMLSFQGAQNLAQGPTRELHFAPAAGQLAKGRSKSD